MHFSSVVWSCAERCLIDFRRRETRTAPAIGPQVRDDRADEKSENSEDHIHAERLPNVRSPYHD